MKARTWLFLIWIAAIPGISWSTPVFETDRLDEMFARGDLVGAETELRHLLAIADDPMARDLLGVALVRQGRLDEAEIELRRAVEMQPDLQVAWLHLARLYLTQGKSAEAFPCLQRAAELGDLDKDLAFGLVQLELENGGFESAKTQLTSIAERFRSVRARLLLARLLSREGKKSEALTVLREALDLAPNSETVLDQYTQLATNMEMAVPAILALEPLVRMHPTNASYAYRMGLARLQVGDNMGAVQYLSEARDLAPPRAIVLLALGLALTGEKRYGEAEEAFLAGLRLEPDLVEIHGALAEVQANLDHLEPAEEHALRALQERPGDSTANFALGLVRFKQGRFEEAIAALETAEATDPDTPKIHYQLSMALIRAGDREGSQAQLQLYRSTLKKREEWLDEQGPKVGAARGGM